MPEMVEIYSENGKFLCTKDNKQVHAEMREEYFKTGKVSIRHKHSKVLLMTRGGKLILQKRSKWKGDNPGFWDKTVGGHAFRHENFDYTAVRECAEEMRIPSTVVNKEHLKESLELIDTKIMAVLFRVELRKNDISVRIEKDSKVWREPSTTAYYMGYYDGPIRFSLAEASGFRISTLHEIEKEIKNNPDEFTNDIIVLLERVKKYIKPARDIV